MRQNKVKQLLREGKPAVGSWLSLSSPIVAETLAHVGFDWLLVDAEHSPIDLETIQYAFVAISTTDTVPFVRVAWNDPAIIKRVLDAGAYGVVIPNVNSKEEAKKAVEACKYPPEGIRGKGYGRADLYAGKDYKEFANREVAVVVQIEHIDAVNAIDEIFSVRGIDAYFIGPGDLATSMGIPVVLGENPDPRYKEAVAKVVASGKKYGIPSGIHVATPEEAFQKMQDGFQFIALGTDSFFLAKSANMAFGKLTELRKNASL